MGTRNDKGYRKELRSGRLHWILDFPYVDKNGKKRRFRRDAKVQTRDGAANEAKKYMANAVATGCPESSEESEKKPGLSFRFFAEGQWSRDYLPLYKPATRQRYRQILVGLVEQFGEMAMTEVGAAQVKGYAARLKERGVSPKGAVDLVRSILRSAHEAALIPSVPAMRGIYQRTEKIPKIYTDHEVELLVDKTDGWLRVAIALGAYAGLRVSEVLALDAGDIDIEAGRLFVRRSLSAGEVSTTKSGKQRVVPLAASLVDVLKPVLKDKGPQTRVIVRSTGTLPTRQNVYTALRRMQKRIGLQPRSFHSLRHSFCTRLLRTGAHIDVVRRLAGHSDLSVTQRYLHTSGDELAEAVARLDAAQ